MTKKPDILWVDDDMMFYKSYLLEAETTYNVTLCKNVDECWQQLVSSEGKYQGIILDVLLPHGKLVNLAKSNGGLRTGIELMKQIRDSKQFSEIPIIIFTIRDSRDVDDEAAKLGVQVLRKQETDLIEFMNVINLEFSK
ncbi:response regulator [Thalassospira povalilytica]|uniref:response regulator n=1 Tax=Thalassospira povalilytica TaxID=732237 RepID=UPI001D195908|nr:response regulator [Thalassospira povalilytica]MCC4242754.1 response regulator [Thalassospira povalilytica]